MASDPIRNQFRATAFEIGGWAGQEKSIRLELSERCTVLVGRNGAGKSLLMEGILQASKNAAARAVRNAPATFRCEATTAEGRRIVYQHVLKSEQEEGSPESVTGITEACWAEDDPTHPLWRAENGLAKLQPGTEVALPQDVGLLGVSAQLPDEIQQIVTDFKNLFTLSRVIRAGVPRNGPRAAAWLFRKEAKDEWVRSGSRLDALCDYLLWAQEKHPRFIQQLRSLATRTGLLKSLDVTILKPTDVPAEIKLPNEVGIITVDKTDLGLASDGTLRALEILWALTFGIEGTLLMIEEPETGFHPGLLGRLLAEIQAYGLDRQILLSTHSQQVVSRFDGSELRFVSTLDGHTTAVPLTPRQVERVAMYLADEGTLGDFVFGGAADE